MNASVKIKQLIQDFEHRKISSEVAVHEINQFSNVELDLDWLCSYSSSISLDMFVKILTIAPIADWSTIDDDRALDILKEILASIHDDAILYRNFEALEKRFAKPEGTVSDWIFWEDITAPETLLRLLKEDTKTTLED